LQGNYNERRTSSYLDVYMRNKHMHQLNKKKKLVFHCKTKEKKLKLITINEIDQVRKSPNQLVKIESDRKRELGVMIDWES
jgi:nickel-dependent lactate racemase